MKTSENAPRSCGSTSRAAASSERSGYDASSAVMISVSVVLCRRRAAHASRHDGSSWLGAPVVRQLAALGRALLDQLEQVAGVGEVAVVPQRDRAGGGGAERRLGVLPDAGTGRGVAGVADREVARAAS